MVHAVWQSRRRYAKALLRPALVPLFVFALALLPMTACGTLFTNPGSSPTSTSESISESVKVVQGQDGATLVLVPVTIQGKGPYTFALDTGASISLIAASLAHQLGLPATGASQPITGIGGVEQAEFVKISKWSTGPIHLPSVSIASAAIPVDRGSGFVGLLGSDIWSRFGRFTLDYSSGTLTVYKQIASAPDEQIAWLDRRTAAA